MLPNVLACPQHFPTPWLPRWTGTNIHICWVIESSRPREIHQSRKKATLLLRRFLEDTTSLATVIIGCLLSFRMTSRISSFSKLNDYITREFAQADVDDLPLPVYLGKDKKSPERNPGAHLFRQYKKWAYTNNVNSEYVIFLDVWILLFSRITRVL